MNRNSLFAPLFALGLILSACGGGLKGPESLQPPEGEQITPPQQPSGSAQPGAPTTPQAEGEAITPDDQPSPQAGTEQPEAPTDPSLNQAADDAAVQENNRQIIDGNIKDLIARGQIPAIQGRINLSNLPSRTGAPANQPASQPAAQPNVVTFPVLKEFAKTIDPSIRLKLLEGVNLQGGRTAVLSDEARRDLIVGQIGTPLREACGTHPGQKLRSDGQCVCAGSAPAAGDTEEDKSWFRADENSPLGIVHLADSTPRCVRKVQKFQLSLRIAKHDGAENTLNDYKFELCRTESFGGDFPCFSAIIKSNPNQRKNDVERIEFSSAASAKWQAAPGSKTIGELRFPDDFLYFRIVPTSFQSSGAFGTGPQTVSDDMLVSGMTLHVMTEGRNLFDTIYRNPCLFRDIRIENGVAIESRHSLFFDDAFCIATRTSTEEANQGAGTDRNIHLIVPMKTGETLSFNTTLFDILQSSIGRQKPHFIPFTPQLVINDRNLQTTENLGVLSSLDTIANPLGLNLNDVLLDMKLDWYDRDDFKEGSRTVYGSSLFNSSVGQGGSTERNNPFRGNFIVASEGGEPNDDWHFDRITTCHVNPRRFATTGPANKCKSLVMTPTQAGREALVDFGKKSFEEGTFPQEEDTCPESCTSAGSTL